MLWFVVSPLNSREDGNCVEFPGLNCDGAYPQITVAACKKVTPKFETTRLAFGSIGLVLAFLKKEGPQLEIGQLIAALPGADELIASTSSGGGGIMGVAGGGGLMALAGQLTSAGLDMSQMQAVGKQLGKGRLARLRPPGLTSCALDRGDGLTRRLQLDEELLLRLRPVTHGGHLVADGAADNSVIQPVKVRSC